MSESTWRPVVAALANDTVREVYGRLLTGAALDEALAPLSPSRRRHVEATLRGAGLVVDSAAGPVRDDAVFARILADAPRAERARGVERFFGPDGRIRTYPARPQDRRDLLREVARRTLTPDPLSEKAVTELLATVSSDPVALRRALVDEGLLERAADGSEYRAVGEL